MKYLKPIYLWAFCIAVALSSCNQGIEPNDNVIRFGYSNETRSLESDYADTYGTTATIWGYNSEGYVYDSNADGMDATLDIDNKTFSIPSIADKAPEYWTSDSYHFYSLWPPIISADDPSKIKYKGADDAGLYFVFDTKEQKDQLASYFSISGNEAASRTEPVEFEYVHILSKLFFNIEANTANANDNIVLLSFSISNVRTSGICSYRETATPYWQPDPEETIELYRNDTVEGGALTNPAKRIVSTQEGTEVVDNGYLIIPQEVGWNAIMIDFTYGFLDDEGEVYLTKSVSRALPNGKIKAWEQNNVYRYYIYLAAESNNIIFGTPTATGWTDNGGSSATIIIQ